MRCLLNFKEFYLQETDVQRQREGQAKMLVYGQNFIFFFLFNGSIYGGGEEARLSYAAMKSNSDDGNEEMVFSARNLSSELEGKPKDDFFTIKDIEEIDIVKNHEAEHLLSKRVNI